VGLLLENGADVNSRNYCGQVKKMLFFYLLWFDNGFFFPLKFLGESFDFDFLFVKYVSDLIYKRERMFIWFVGSNLIMGIFLKFLWWKCWFFLVQYFSDGEINKSWNFCFIRTLSLIVEFWIVVSVNISYVEMNETQILISFGCCLFLKPD